VIVSAIDDSGNNIESEIMEKIFSLSAQSVVSKTLSPEQNKKLDDIELRSVSIVSAEIAERNGKYFDDEINKLDSWAEDKRRALKAELKYYDDQIGLSKKEARLAPNLPEKLAIQKKIRELDAKRNIAWKQYDESAKVIEQQKDGLLDTVEKRLKQKAEKETLFSIRWKIV